jgi:hypothetical protein
MSTSMIMPTLKLPHGWEEQRVQITWLAPAEFIAVEGQPARPTPRSNIVLSLIPAEPGDNPIEARNKFIQQTRTSISGLTEIEHEDKVVFADGKLGSLIVVEFQATSDTRLRQTHLFRIDEDVVAQLVTTVDADAVSDEQETELRNAALSYSPAAD